MKPTTPLISLGQIPLLEVGEVIAVVIAGDHLPMTAVGEELQTLRGLAAVPVGDLGGHLQQILLHEPLSAAVDQVIMVDYMHYGGDQTCRTRQRSSAWGLTALRDRFAAPCVLGEELARRLLAALTAQAPVGHADFVVGHEKSLGAEQLV